MSRDKYSPFQLTPEQANAPKPKPPDQPLWHRAWTYYFEDLACWKATRAEKYLSGIRETKGQ